MGDFETFQNGCHIRLQLQKYPLNVTIHIKANPNQIPYSKHTLRNPIQGFCNLKSSAQ